MPDTNVVESIVRRSEEFTEDEWLRILSSRTEHMRPIMDRVTLTKLGDIKFFNSVQRRQLALGAWYGAPSYHEQVLRHQGIFKTLLLRSPSDASDPVFVIWGMLRDTTWFAFELSTAYCYWHRIKYFKAQKVTPSILNKEYGIHYHQLWYLLSETVHEFTEQRRAQLRVLEQLEQQFEREDSLIKPFAR